MIRYHIIPHTHWDREWYLSFDEFRTMLVNMIDDLVDLLDEVPTYQNFLLDGQTSVIDDYLEVRPERTQLLVDLISAGRISVGPWYVLPDSFLVSGESMVRNLLLGTRTAREMGVDGFVGYIPDSFGHTAQIPQILRGFGLDSAIMWRGFGGEPGQEGSEYRWFSPDGSFVLAEHLNDNGYSGAYFDSDDANEIEVRFAAMRAAVDPRATSDTRLMLSGGDHHWPNKYLTGAIAHLNNQSDGSYEVVHSTLTTFFENLRRNVDLDELPAIHGELRFGYRGAFNVTGGVYSTRMYLKQDNARSQRLLEGYLEPLNAIAVARGHVSQAPMLRQAWKTLLQNHPHDSICGCSIDEVHREMTVRTHKVDGIERGVSRFLWNALTGESEGDRSDDRQIVVFNSAGRSRSEIVECDVEFYRQDVVVGLNPDVVPAPPTPPVLTLALTDGNGKPVPVEVISREEGYGISYTRYNYPSQSRVDRFRIRFQASEVPAVGFKTFAVHPRIDSSVRVPTVITSGASEMGNEFINVRADESGAFFLVDKRTGAEFGPLGVLEDTGEAGDEYNYSPPARDTVITSGDRRSVHVRVISGQFRTGLMVSGILQLPEGLDDTGMARSETRVDVPFETTAWITVGSPCVTFETTIDNRARDHRLRVLFETGCETNDHAAENGFCVVERTQRIYDSHEFKVEVPTAVSPMKRFVLLEENDRGFALFSDGLPEYELKHDSGGVIALTLLRCVGLLSGDELFMRPGGRAGWYNETPEAQCLGVYRFRYAVMPYTTPWSDNYMAIEEAATAFVDPMRCRAVKVPSRDVNEYSLFSISRSELVVSAVKQSEDGQDTIIRCYNPTKKSIEADIRFGHVPKHVFQSRLDETKLEEMLLVDGAVTDTWHPAEIKTFLVDFGSSGSPYN